MERLAKSLVRLFGVEPKDEIASTFNAAFHLGQEALGHCGPRGQLAERLVPGEAKGADPGAEVDLERGCAATTRVRARPALR